MNKNLDLNLLISLINTNVQFYFGNKILNGIVKSITLSSNQTIKIMVEIDKSYYAVALKDIILK